MSLPELAGRAQAKLGNVSAALLLGAPDTPGPTAPALAQTARMLDRCFTELLLVGGAPPPSLPGRAVADVVEPPAPPCPLRGLVSALRAATSERVVVVACDLVATPIELVLALVAWPERDAVVPRRGDRPQPLCAIYRRAGVLELASARLSSGDLALTALLDAVDCDYLEGADLEALDPDGAAFRAAGEPQSGCR